MSGKIFPVHEKIILRRKKTENTESIIFVGSNDSDAKRLIKFFFIVSDFLWNCPNAETSA